MKFRNDIQGLRALAVFLVFVFHLNSDYLPGGFIGVDIFFVISGFLISSIILHKKEKGDFQFKDFYLGRVKRIVPNYFLFLIIIFSLGCFIYLPVDIASLRANVFHAAIFNSNNYLATLDTYFGAKGSENPLLHTWTLAIEMQFYFILPLLLIFLNKKFVPIVVTFLIVILFGYSFHNSTFLSNKSAMYFSLLARIPEFLIGTLAAIYADHLSIRKRRLRDLLSFVSLILILAAALVINEQSNFPGLIVLLPCLAVVFILTNSDAYLNKTILSNKLLVHIGELSYSIYLWHWGLMALLRYYNVRYEFTFLEVLLLTISIYFISYLSFKYIESNSRILTSKKLIINLSIMCMALAISAFLVPKINIAFFSNITKKYAEPTFGLDSHSITFKDFIRYGDLHKKNDSILLIGDSHALIYIGILDNIGRNNSFNFSAITNNTYPTIPGIDRKDFANDILYNEYKYLAERSFSEIKNSKVILISSIWNPNTLSLPDAFENFAKRLRKDQKVIILADFPTIDRNPIRYNRSVVRKNDMDNNYIIKIREIPEEINKIINKYPNIYKQTKIDFAHYKAEIPFYRDTVMYYDKDHLNIHGAEFISKKIEKEFMKEFDSILK